MSKILKAMIASLKFVLAGLLGTIITIGPLIYGFLEHNGVIVVLGIMWAFWVNVSIIFYNITEEI